MRRSVESWQIRTQDSMQTDVSHIASLQTKQQTDAANRRGARFAASFKGYSIFLTTVTTRHLQHELKLRAEVVLVVVGIQDTDIRRAGRSRVHPTHVSSELGVVAMEVVI